MTPEPIVVIYPFVGSEFGGSDISAVKLIQSLNLSEVKPVVVVHSEHGDFTHYLDEQNVAYLPLPEKLLRPEHSRRATDTAWHYPLTAMRLARFLRRHNAEIVHTNSGLIHATWALPAVSAGARLLWHHRGDPAARGVNLIAPLLASHIICVSDYARPSSPVIPVGQRLSVVRSPFEHPQSLPNRAACRKELIEELGLHGETRLLGFFGALIDRKRPLRFVEAIHAFKSRYPGARVAGLLFGAVEQYGRKFDDEVRKRAQELQISDAIHLMGFRSPVDKSMAAVDLLLVPAVNEPFGRTLIEAMLLGTPVIATNHGGNPEAISDGVTGYLVEAENPAAFVEPIALLLNDRSEWERIAENARQAALSCYGTDNHNTQIMKIYRKLSRRAA